MEGVRIQLETERLDEWPARIRLVNQHVAQVTQANCIPAFNWFYSRKLAFGRGVLGLVQQDVLVEFRDDEVVQFVVDEYKVELVR